MTEILRRDFRVTREAESYGTVSAQIDHRFFYVPEGSTIPDLTTATTGLLAEMPNTVHFALIPGSDYEHGTPPEGTHWNATGWVWSTFATDGAGNLSNWANTVRVGPEVDVPVPYYILPSSVDLIDVSPTGFAAAVTLSFGDNLSELFLYNPITSEWVNAIEFLNFNQVMRPQELQVVLHAYAWAEPESEFQYTGTLFDKFSLRDIIVETDELNPHPDDLSLGLIPSIPEPTDNTVLAIGSGTAFGRPSVLFELDNQSVLSELSTRFELEFNMLAPTFSGVENNDTILTFGPNYSPELEEGISLEVKYNEAEPGITLQWKINNLDQPTALPVALNENQWLKVIAIVATEDFGNGQNLVLGLRTQKSEVGNPTQWENPTPTLETLLTTYPASVDLINGFSFRLTALGANYTGMNSFAGSPYWIILKDITLRDLEEND